MVTMLTIIACSSESKTAASFQGERKGACLRIVVGGMQMPRTRCCRWRGVLVAVAVLAGGLMLVPAALADIVGSPAGASTPNAGLGGFKNGNGWNAQSNRPASAYPPVFNV